MSVTFNGESGKHPTLVQLNLTWEHPAFLNLNIGNAAALLGLLKLPNEPCGEVTMPEARRAIMQAKARFERVASDHTREGSDAQQPGRARFVRGSLDENGLRVRLERFEEFVNVMDRMGAERILWS